MGEDEHNYGPLPRDDACDVGVEGADVSRDLGRFNRQLGVGTQEDTFDGHFTVRQYLEVAARYFRPRPPEVRRRVDELLEATRPDTVGRFCRFTPSTMSCARRATVRLLLLVGVQPHALQDGRVLQGDRHA